MAKKDELQILRCHPDTLMDVALKQQAHWRELAGMKLEINMCKDLLARIPPFHFPTNFRLNGRIFSGAEAYAVLERVANKLR